MGKNKGKKSSKYDHYKKDEYDEEYRKLEERRKELAGERSAYRRSVAVEEVLPAVVAVVISALLIYWLWYVSLPAVNGHSVGFWTAIIVSMGIFGIIGLIIEVLTESDILAIILKIVGIGIVVLLVLIIVFSFSNAKIFHAKAYSKLLKVEEGTKDVIPSSNGGTESIALMDTDSAKILGNREVGSLTNVVSQYELDDYTQINYQNKPYKVGELHYGGLFKWKNNKSKGVPGYVLVNPVTFKGEYVKLEKGMRYVPSAYFRENLKRHIRSKYPSLMYRNLHFEIDEEGHPWYVATTYRCTIGMFCGQKITGCIVIDPITGKIQKFKTGKIPEWIDVVFDGDWVCEHYNDYAQLQNGFWNSVFGQKGCRKVTEYRKSSDDDDSSNVVSDFGYICKDNDVYIYTGVTSVTNDSSNLGFIISNERTGETKFIECPGADEFSAMQAAEGEVQEKRYTASFPSLIEVDGVPTYIMVLKDDNGIVKLYSCVCVGEYSKVATATDQKDCIEKYKMLLNGDISKEDAVNENVVSENTENKKSDETQENEESSESYVEKEITVKHLEKIDRQGDTYLYLVDTENNIYYAKYEDVIQMLLIKDGDKIKIYTDGEKFKYPNK